MKLDKALINKKILVQLGLFELLRGFSFLLFAFFLTSIITQNSNQIILVCTTLIFRSVSEYFIARLMRKFSHEIQLQTRRKIHEAIFRLDLIDPARILTLATETVSKIDLLITKIFPVVFSAVVSMPMILIVTLIFDPISAGIFLITLPIAPILLFLIGKATREKSERAWFELNELNRDFHELLDGILTLKIFGQLKRAEKKLFETSEKSAEATLDVLKLAFVSAFAVELITTLSIAIIAVTVGLRLLAGDVNFFTAFLILILAPEYFSALRSSGIVFHTFIEFKTAKAELEKFFESVPKFGTGFVVQTRMPPEITVDRLSFKYPGKNFFVLQNLSMTFKPNQITVVKGLSGSGKSTLLKLLAGFFLPTDGKIFWNELDLSTIDRQSIFSKIAYVPQFPKIFAGTLRDNVTMFGKYELDPEILTRLGFSSLDFELESLSNGELNRLGLARALMKKSKIVLLDEPTAGLDSKTEKIVLELLSEWKYFRTIIVASHRESVINWADVVIDIKKDP